jgi:hypothetical protein
VEGWVIIDLRTQSVFDIVGVLGVWVFGCVGVLCGEALGVLGFWVYWVFGCGFFWFFFLRRNCVGLGMNFFFGLASDDDDEESGLAQGILKQTD